MLNLEELLNNPTFSFGLNLLGASHPKNYPLLYAGQALQAQRKAKREEEMEAARMGLYRAQIDQLGAKNAIAERDAKRQEEIWGTVRERLARKGMMGGTPQPGAQEPISAPPMSMPQEQQLPPMQPAPSVGRHGTPTYILDNLLQIESSGGKNLIGPRLPEGDHALGPYQFRQGTKNMLLKQGYPDFNLFDLNQSRDAADFYLQSLVKKHGGDYSKALADYGGFKTKDPTSYVSRALKGGPESQAMQMQQIQQQRSDPRPQQYAQIQPPAIQPEEQEEFSIDTDGKITLNLKQGYEGARTRIQAGELALKAQQEQRARREYEDAPNRAQQEVFSKKAAEDFIGAQTEERKASVRLGRINQIGAMLERLNTGKITPSTTEFQAWAKSVGIPVDPKMPAAQAVDVISKLQSMELKEMSPGAVTEWEAKTWQQLYPNIDKDPLSNRILVNAYRKQQERHLGIAKIFREHRKANGGRVTQDVYDEIASYMEANPLFNPKEIEQMMGGGNQPGQAPLPNSLSREDRLQYEEYKRNRLRQGSW